MGWRYSSEAASLFWGLMTAGCFLGLVLLKLFDSRRVLVGFSAAAMIGLVVMALIGFKRDVGVLWSTELAGEAPA